MALVSGPRTRDPPVVSDLPSGTVTFLFTDVEGSTRLLHELGARYYAEALAEHRRALREAFACHGGVEVDTQGDAFFIAFATAQAALAAAAQAQAELDEGPIRVRMGIHTGAPLLTEEGYVGADVHRAARIAAAGHGGQVLVSSATAALVETSHLRNLGEHRLKDLLAPERLYQLGETDFPPLRSLYRTNLPVPSTPFAGREQELQELLGLITRADVRLLTLTGPGGTGKTRLGLQAAGELPDQYPDGVWWVPLAPLRDHQLVLETAAHVVDAKDGLAAHIGDQSMLVLFDNFEHVVEAADELGRLLQSCPRLELLVTSREPLHVTGEQEYAVPPFAQEEGVDFFLTRARAVTHDFERTAAVSEICLRLDNLPLALELAAARVKALSAEEIVERLERRIPLLTGGLRDVPARQRTLHAAIQWSYELLSEDEQRLFGRLAVFAGGFTLESSEAVTEAGLDDLQSLVDKSLLRHRERRYWMLETIREFAGEQLSRAGEYASIASAHAEYFTEVAERAGSTFGTSDEPTWIKLLARELANIRAALAHLDGSLRQLRLVSALWRFWEQQGHYTEGRRWLRAALEQRQGASPADVVEALLGAGALARCQGDFHEAERLTNESISVARGSGLRSSEARAVGTLSNIALARGDFRRAAELLAETQALFRELGDEKRLAITINNSAYLALEMGDYDASLALADEGRGLSRTMGDPASVVSASINLSLAALSLGRHETAKEAIQEALELAGDVGHTAYLAVALIVTAALIASADPTTAAALLAAADKAQRDLMLELDPVERDLRAAVEGDLRVAHMVDLPDISTDDLPVVLSAAAARALESLANFTTDTAS
jgi:predicted ATPase/class 3 adenylate cyclase